MQIQTGHLKTIISIHVFLRILVLHFKYHIYIYADWEETPVFISEC